MRGRTLFRGSNFRYPGTKFVWPDEDILVGLDVIGTLVHFTGTSRALLHGNEILKYFNVFVSIFDGN